MLVSCIPFSFGCEVWEVWCGVSQNELIIICWFQGQHTEYDFKGGAGATCINKQCDQKNASIHLEARSPKPNLKDDLSDDENRDFMNVTPVRHSARTAGKTFKYSSCYFYLSQYIKTSMLSQGCPCVWFFF